MTNFDFLTNFKPIIIDDIFTDEEYKSVYDMTEATFNAALKGEANFNENNNGSGAVFVDKNTGYASMTNSFSAVIQNKILATFRRYVELSDNIMLNTHVARYTHKSGYTPNLRPHFDRGLRFPSYTMSIQLDKTLDWDLGANGTTANLSSNQALMFSGSHQAHYRPPVEFKEDDVYDVIVCQVQMMDYPRLDLDAQDMLLKESLRSYSDALGYEKAVEPIEPKEFENFFTPEEYASIYEVVNSVMAKGLEDGDDKYLHMPKITNNGFIIFTGFRETEIGQKVINKVKDFFESIIEEPVREVGVLFARYTKDSGSNPTLMPHGDRNEKHLALTLTVELDKTLDWPFVVEDTFFDMRNNLGVLFSGSHQPHWRPDLEFGDKDYYDIILLQTHALSDDTLLDEDFFVKMDHKAAHYREKYYSLLARSISKIRPDDKPQ